MTTHHQTTAITKTTPPPPADNLPAVIPHSHYEVAVAAAAAQAKATVSARYEMALRRPRNWDQVRVDILKECSRPSFAMDKSAWYRKPIGNGVEGLGIRFVEMALRCMGNVLIEQEVRYEDEWKEVIRVTVTDLEANNTWPGDVKVTKTVERSKPSDDGSYLSMRINSYNKPVYTVAATDDDLLNKRAALVSKAVRTIGLRVIPGDIKAEAEDKIKAVREDKARQDPDAEAKRIADAFMELRITPAMLTAYLGHPIGQCSPAQLVDLRGLFGAIRDGEATWHEVMDNKEQQQGSEGGAPAAPTVPLKSAKPATEAKEEAPAREADVAPPQNEPNPASQRELQPGQAGFNDGSAREGEESKPHDTGELATPGERQNLLARIKASKKDIFDLLDAAHIAQLGDPMTLEGLTKAQYTALRKLLP